MTAEARADTPHISVVIITRNEAQNIAACLQSLTSFDEVIVVDNGSTDQTCAIVQTFSNTRLIQCEWKGYGATRQVGVDAARNDWILWLDADERMSAALAREIETSLHTAHPALVLSLPRKNYFLGQHIRGCGWSPNHVNRVFNRTWCRFDEKNVHEGITGHGTIELRKMNSAIDHFSYTELKQFFEKNFRYAQLAGLERRRTGRKVFAIELFVRPIWEFFRCYILRAGFADGLRGLVISYGAAIYVFTRDAYCVLEKDQKQSQR